MIVHNNHPIKSKGGKTIVGIVSKSDKQSKHLLAGIRELMYMGDDYLNSDATRPEYHNFFANRLSKKQVDTNNKTHLTFRLPMKNEKGEIEASGKVMGEIISIPATDSARGFTFSKLFMDEAAFFENDTFFDTIAEPTLRATDGKSVVTTTPNGQKGWFFSVFDPFDDIDKNPNVRLWLHYDHIENSKERDAVLKKRDAAMRRGEIKLFEQEYEAKFTADARAFFDPEKVDLMFDKSLVPWDNYDKPTDLGLDVGFKSSRTIITITRLGDDGIIRRVWHYTYPKSDDLPVVQDIIHLIPKYNVQRVIIDDCPAASSIIQQLRKLGVNVKLMNFKTSKTAKYFQFRAKMYEGLLYTYPDKKLAMEMKAIEEVDGKRMTRIEKPIRGSDDIIDSFIISSFYFVEDKKEFKGWDWDEL